MEDDEDTKNPYEPLPQEVGSSNMEEKEKPLETVEVTNTEQCEFVPESLPQLGDSQLLSAESPVEAKDDEAVAEVTVDCGMQTETEGVSVPEVDDSPLVGAKSPIVREEVDISTAGTAVEIKAEAGMVEPSLGKSVTELDDSLLVGDMPPIKAKDVEAVVVKEIPTAGMEMEMKAEVEQVKSGLGNSIPELDDSQLAGTNSPSVAKDGEAVGVGEISTVGTEMEMKCEAEAEAVEGGLVSEFDDSQLAGVNSLILDELVAKGEIPRAGTEMEMENEVEGIESGGEEFVSKLDDSQLLGVESSIAAKEDEDNEVMAEDTGMEDAEMETETELANEVETKSAPYLDDQVAQSPIVARDDDDDEDVAAVEEETPMADTEMETETDVAEMAEAEKGVGGGEKRKRGRISRIPGKAPARKVIEEDVCFICFDGGDLVLCDRRGCPKAYHPSCVNRDEAFFRSKGRWNCGWHLCSICQKNAHYMCYTCTFSLCKACIKDAIILCVRGNKGFCETCMKTVMLIENNKQANKEDQIDFDDKSSWEFLFKDYWTDLKAKLSLSSVELAQAKNPWKGSDVLAGKQESPEVLFDANNDLVSGSDSSENIEVSKRKRKKATKRSKSLTKEEELPSSTTAIAAEGPSIPGNTEWASKELLEFVMHMKNGDKSALSQFDVQAMLLEYIKRNKLRDPRRKSQIICDSRLENFFGKARVGHFEMLKLLESHFLVKEDFQTDDVQGTVVDTELHQLEADGNIEAPIKGSKDRRRKTRKKGDGRGPQSNLDDYAAIDIHNINLIYLRRKLVEDLLEDIEKFHDKVVGTFVRIRISGTNQKQDIYRLVQVVGLSKAAEPYKVGKKTTEMVLEILNLNKTEVVSIDTISNQEFTEDECNRLRQSIKCGLINRLTVGDILDKAMEVQAARVNDWLETEIVRLSHLRDRASEKGRRKELRECVEKLQLLKTPEERRRRLEEIPEIHADPNMDPSYESEEDDSEMEDNKQEIYTRPRGSGFSRKGREPISPRRGSFSSTDSWGGTRRNPGKNLELNRNTSNKDFLNKGEVATLVGEIPNENAWNQGRDKDTQQANNMEKVNSATNSDTIGQNSDSFVRSEPFPGAASETSQASLSAGVVETDTKISGTEKMWHYQDPSGKVQGPFSIVQLRKWNNTGYFPVDLKIWRATEKQDNSFPLADALAGRFPMELPPMDNNIRNTQTVHSPHLSTTHDGKPYGASSQEERSGQGGERLNFDQSPGAWNSNNSLGPSSQSSGESWRSKLEQRSSSGLATPSVEVPKLSSDRLGSDYTRNDSFNLPSPTPKSSTPGWNGGQTSESKWSSSSLPVQQAGSVVGVNSFPGVNGPMQLPPVATPESGQLIHSSTSSSIDPSGSKEHHAMESLGVSAPASVLNFGRQLMRGSENDSPSSLTGTTPAPYSEQGIPAGSTTALPTSQTIVNGESHGIRPPVETHGWASGSVPVRPSQTPGNDSQVWGGASSQKIEPNSALPVPVQPVAYGHWVGIPSTVQNPAGNFSTPGFSAMPQPDPWRPPVAGNQSNIQPAAPPNVAWGMGVAATNSFSPGPRPDNPNIGWGPMQLNSNMGWGGAVPGTTNMNWGAAVQGPVPGTVNPGWVDSAGNPGAIIQGLAPGNANPGWAAQAGNAGSTVQGPPPGNGNPGWVASTGNAGTNVQGLALGNVNQVWGTPTGNPGTTTVQGPAPGNANPGWGAPAGNTGMWGSKKHQNGDRFRDGQRDRGSQGRDSGYGGGRPWNRQSSFGSGGQGVCRFHQSGRCKKGASCNRLHI